MKDIRTIAMRSLKKASFNDDAATSNRKYRRRKSRTLKKTLKRFILRDSQD